MAVSSVVSPCKALNESKYLEVGDETGDGVRSGVRVGEGTEVEVRVGVGEGSGKKMRMTPICRNSSTVARTPGTISSPAITTRSKVTDASAMRRRGIPLCLFLRSEGGFATEAISSLPGDCFVAKNAPRTDS